ncbi:hypothetical protein ANRL1_04832 [Anaerolineae bacterium]|nr:hypothetical protein ANRL1_04832 [Anaerolineae bacterium]
MRIVIPSKNRVDDCAHALTLFPDALVVVNEEQLDLYKRLGCELLGHPRTLAGIGPLKNWIMDNVPDETLFIIDDDVKLLRVAVGRETRSEVIRDPQDIRQIVENAAEVARGIGAPVFGFDQTGGDTRKFNPAHPFRLSGWVGAQVGIVGRAIRYDPNLRVRADIDFCLTALLTKRIIFQDTRFSFVHQPRFTYRGGNALSRSGERNKQELAYLKTKWGDVIRFRRTDTTLRILVKVKRRADQKN